MRLNQSSNLTNEEISAWDEVLAKHLDVYGTKMIPSLLRKRSSFDERKILPDFQQRVIALVELCSHITFMFPANNNEMRKHCFEVIQKIVKCHSINDRLIHRTLWKAMFLMVQQSDFSAFYIVFLEKVLTQLITRDEDLSQILLVQYYSLNDRNREETLLMLIECICNAFQTITMSFTVKAEMQDPIGDEFMSSIFSVTFHLAELVKTIYKSPVKGSSIRAASRTLLTELFTTICTIGKHFQQQEAREWSSVDELAEFVQTILKSIIAATLENRAEEEGDEEEMKLHSRLLMLAKVLVDERFELNILNQGFRDFQLNNSLLIQRLGPTDQVDPHEAEVISVRDDDEEEKRMKDCKECARHSSHKKDENEDDKGYTQSTINDSAFDWNNSCRMSGLFKKARNS
uniref:Uncharacterized protein n=1 Tax=Ditylenchus dipsaci TaxID=166011 RepID=A0A915DUK1_9BILA